MSLDSNEQKMLNLAAKFGSPISASANELDGLKLHEVRIVDLLPDLLVMIRSLVAKEDFFFQRNPITTIDNGLLISFQNVFSDRHEENNNTINNFHQERPHVRITPSHLESDVRFSKYTQVRQITIFIEMEYLKRFLGKDQHRFSYLFDVERTFWIEEFMSAEIAVLVDCIINTTYGEALSDSFYRLKCLEILYLLFNNLSHREPVPHQHMSTKEIDSIYSVRNAMALSLDKALPVSELVRLSGMNELKLRRLFTQVFGKGLYAYHQHLRMIEAARLLKEEKLSVSETGFRLGFTNLSYFGRLFDEHMGMKPKKWTRFLNAGYQL